MSPYKYLPNDVTYMAVCLRLRRLLLKWKKTKTTVWQQEKSQVEKLQERRPLQMETLLSKPLTTKKGVCHLQWRWTQIILTQHIWLTTYMMAYIKINRTVNYTHFILWYFAGPISLINLQSAVNLPTIPFNEDKTKKAKEKKSKNE